MMTFSLWKTKYKNKREIKVTVLTNSRKYSNRIDKKESLHNNCDIKDTPGRFETVYCY